MRVMHFDIFVISKCDVEVGINRHIDILGISEVSGQGIHFIARV